MQPAIRQRSPQRLVSGAGAQRTQIGIGFRGSGIGFDLGTLELVQVNFSFKLGKNASQMGCIVAV
jgi:hypothetical protein